MAVFWNIGRGYGLGHYAGLLKMEAAGDSETMINI